MSIVIWLKIKGVYGKNYFNWFFMLERGKLLIKSKRIK